MERREWEELFRRLDHPFPLVMIDKVGEIEKGGKILASKWVSVNDFYLAGHFPGEPIMPGVLTLEGMVQCALILAEETHDRGRVRCSLRKVDRVRFKRAVLPGDRLDFLVTVASREGALWKCKGKALVGSETASEADLLLEVEVREMGFEL